MNMAVTIPTRASLRRFMRQVLPNDSAVNAFIIDYFYRAWQGISEGMDRSSKESRLLACEAPAVILNCLRQAESQRCHEHANLLEPDLDAVAASRMAPPSAGMQDPSVLHHHESLNFARHLDRSKQWETVVKHCEGNSDTVFLLHGAKQHNLSFFLDRVVADLQAKINAPQKLIFVPFKLGIKKALCGRDWDKHLSASLYQALSEGQESRHLLAPSAEQMITLITREIPLFIILGNRRPLEFAKDKKIELAGVIEFVRRNLPELALRRQSCAVRFLIPIEYEKYSDSLIDPLKAAFMELALTSLHPVEIDSPKVPEWEEILIFLRGIRRADRYTKEVFPVSDEEIQECSKRYQRLNKSTFTFQELVEELKAVIEP